MQILYQHKHVTFVYYPENECLVQTWSGFINSDEWRKIQTHLVSLSQQYVIKRIIADTLLQSVVNQEDTKWTALDITPKMVSNGLRFLAFVVPKDEFAQITINTYTENAQEQLQIRHFATIEEAQNWISAL